MGDSEENLEARGGIEPPLEVLQTSALPLGDRASVRWSVRETSRCYRERLFRATPEKMPALF